jgi:hypothetical protein
MTPATTSVHIELDPGAPIREQPRASCDAPTAQVSGGCRIRSGDVGLRAQRRRPSVRGRDVRRRTPPAQIRTSGFPASGSYLGCLTAKRMLGQG